MILCVAPKKELTTTEAHRRTRVAFFEMLSVLLMRSGRKSAFVLVSMASLTPANVLYLLFICSFLNFLFHIGVELTMLC